MREFHPAATYAELKVQAYALAQSLRATKALLTYQRTLTDELVHKLKMCSQEAIQAERATNELLTEALDRAEAEIMELKHEIKMLS